MPRDLLREFIDLVVEKREPFNPRALQVLTPRELLQYVKKFEFVDQGSTRRVYRVSTGKVLKVAIGPKGVAQNKAELQVTEQSGHQDMFPKVFDKDPAGLWILVEAVAPVSEAEFASLAGIEYQLFDRFTRLVEERKTVLNATIEMEKWFESKQVSEEDQTAFFKNPFLLKIIDLIREHDVLPMDIGKLSSYGRSASGKIVLLDSGFTEGVYQDAYRGAGRHKANYDGSDD